MIEIHARINFGDQSPSATSMFAALGVIFAGGTVWSIIKAVTGRRGSITLAGNVSAEKIDWLSRLWFHKTGEAAASRVDEPASLNHRVGAPGVSTSQTVEASNQEALPLLEAPPGVDGRASQEAAPDNLGDQGGSIRTPVSRSSVEGGGGGKGSSESLDTRGNEEWRHSLTLSWGGLCAALERVYSRKTSKQGDSE